MATFNASNSKTSGIRTEPSADEFDEIVECESDSNSETNSASNATVGTPTKKKPKRLCRYRADWSVEFSWSTKVTGNVFAADCNLCRKTVSIGHGGRNDLLQHSRTDGHKKAVRAAITTSVHKFYTNVSQPTGIDRQVGLRRIIWGTCR